MRRVHLSGIRGDDGEPIADPSVAAEALREHWQEVFTMKPIDSKRMSLFIPHIPKVKDDMHGLHG